MHLKTIWLGAAAALAMAGSPTLARAAPPPLEAYGDLPAVEDIAISPGGNIGTIAQADGQRRVIAIKPDATVLINAPVGDTKVRGVDWADDDLLLITTTATVALGPNFTI